MHTMEHQNRLGENADSSYILLDYHADAKRLEITIIADLYDGAYSSINLELEQVQALSNYLSKILGT